MRKYPSFPTPTASPKRPISFVTVHFSNELEHNLLTSPMVSDGFNELIIVDNRKNLFFNTLGQAMIHGLNQAQHDLIVFIHEDVVLRDGWQQQFERSLHALEQVDPNWGMLGPVGWNEQQQGKGAVSDPHGWVSNFGDEPFHLVVKLDEQLLAFNRDRMPDIDPDLPSIHFIGVDLARQLKQRQLHTYAIDAATIHKYADANGALIQQADQSPKIVDRKARTYLSDHSLSQDYLWHKWNMAEGAEITITPNPEQSAILDSPIILLGRGGGGTRLLSSIVQDCDLFIGNTVNISGDCMEMVNAMYRGVITKHQSNVAWQNARITPEIRATAGQMLETGDWPTEWGFKLPESLVLLPELHAAFPNARYVHFKRDPLATVLRRSHMTARLDNHIGRVTVRAAYDFFDLDRAQALTADDATRMAITTAHQLALVETHRATIPQNRWLDLSFEDTIANPSGQLEHFAQFANLPVMHNNTAQSVNADRSSKGAANFAPETRARIAALYETLTAQTIA
jgi:hypothetical protein